MFNVFKGGVHCGILKRCVAMTSQQQTIYSQKIASSSQIFVCNFHGCLFFMGPNITASSSQSFVCNFHGSLLFSWTRT